MWNQTPLDVPNLSLAEGSLSVEEEEETSRSPWSDPNSLSRESTPVAFPHSVLRSDARSFAIASSSAGDNSADEFDCVIVGRTLSCKSHSCQFSSSYSSLSSSSSSSDKTTSPDRSTKSTTKCKTVSDTAKTILVCCKASLGSFIQLNTFDTFKNRLGLANLSR